MDFCEERTCIVLGLFQPFFWPVCFELISLKNPSGVNRTCTVNYAFLMLWVISPTYCSSYLLQLVPSM